MQGGYFGFSPNTKLSGWVGMVETSPPTHQIVKGSNIEVIQGQKFELGQILIYFLKTFFFIKNLTF